MRHFGHNGILEISISDDDNQRIKNFLGDGYEEYPTLPPPGNFQFIGGQWVDVSPKPTPAEINAVIRAQLREADIKIIRALTEGDNVKIAAHVAAQAVLRAKLI